jgi:hypothetical protein
VKKEKKKKKKKRSKSILTTLKRASGTARSLRDKGEQRDRKWRRDKNAQVAE